jgi:PAS domain S-box-containing protein
VSRKKRECYWVFSPCPAPPCVDTGPWELLEWKRANMTTATDLEDLDLLATVFDVARTGICVISEKGLFTKVNPAFCAMVGYASEELVGREYAICAPPAVVAVMEKFLAANLADSAKIPSEWQIRRRDGSLFDALVSSRPVTRKNGQRFLVVTFSDITEREAILNLSVVGIALVRNRDFVWVNKAFEQDMLGYEAGELAGKSSIMTYPSPEMYNDLGPQIDKILVEQGTFKIEERVRRKDGSMMWCLVTGRIVERGDLSKGSIWTIVDISKRRVAEVELLESLAREKEASELKSRFVSMTSHEFRTPLAAILSSIELIADYGERLPGEEKAELVGVIKSSVKRMGQMLEDILVIGRADAGRLEFNPEPVDLKSLCERIAQEARKTTQTAHEVELQCTLKKKHYLLDERLLRHVLHNLLINAIKYSPQSGRVGLRVMAGEASMKFIVEDQGIGIPLEDQAGLFTSFHRGANVGGIAGTGLGLAIVKKAVDLHGGSIRVESAVGKGSQFTVILPEARGKSND